MSGFARGLSPTYEPRSGCRMPIAECRGRGMTTTLPDLNRLGREAADAERAHHAACKATDEAHRVEDKARLRWEKAKTDLAAAVAAYGVAAVSDPTAPQAPRDVRVSWWWWTWGTRHSAIGNAGPRPSGTAPGQSEVQKDFTPVADCRLPVAAFLEPRR